MDKNPFISICIPSYNRPEKLRELLESVDSTRRGEVEIVICEDKSPKRERIRKAVEDFKRNSEFSIVYKENKDNLGYDRNLKELIKNAAGEWIVFMGDDDQFAPKALDKVINFLKINNNLGYLLRSHYTNKNGKIEQFRYYKGTQFFSPGAETLMDLFRKSVFISGFTIRRSLVLPHLIDDFDGTALFQIYLLGEVVLKHNSAYLDEPFTCEIILDDYRKKEILYLPDEKVFIPRPCSVENSLKFLSGYAKVMEFFDKKYNLNITPAIKKDMSKYFYPSLSIHRDKGIKIFLEYVVKVNRLGFNISIYYYFYIVLLIVFGKNICDKGINIIKNILGRTPKL